MIYSALPGDKLIGHIVYSGYSEDEAMEIAADYEHLMIRHELADVYDVARMVFVDNVSLEYMDTPIKLVWPGAYGLEVQRLQWVVEIDATVY